MFGTFSSLFRGLDSRRLFLCIFVDAEPLQMPIGSQIGTFGASLDLKLGRISGHFAVWVLRWVRDAPRVTFRCFGGVFWEHFGGILSVF